MRIGSIHALIAAAAVGLALGLLPACTDGEPASPDRTAGASGPEEHAGSPGAPEASDGTSRDDDAAATSGSNANGPDDAADDVDGDGPVGHDPPDAASPGNDEAPVDESDEGDEGDDPTTEDADPADDGSGDEAAPSDEEDAPDGEDPADDGGSDEDGDARREPLPASAFDPSNVEVDEDGVVRGFHGIEIDVAGRRITVDGQLCLDHGPLEYLCITRTSGKGHESLVYIDCDPRALNLGLLLLGLEPSHEITEEGQEISLTGDRVVLELAWEDSDGEEVRERAEDLVLLRGPEGITSPMPRVGFTYTGSAFASRRVRDDDGEWREVERYGALVFGIVVSIWHHPFSVLDNPMIEGASDERWLARTDALPDPGTPLRLHVRPAGPDDVVSVERPDEGPASASRTALELVEVGRGELGDDFPADAPLAQVNTAPCVEPDGRFDLSEGRTEERTVGVQYVFTTGERWRLVTLVGSVVGGEPETFVRDLRPPDFARQPRSDGEPPAPLEPGPAELLDSPEIVRRAMEVGLDPDGPYALSYRQDEAGPVCLVEGPEERQILLDARTGEVLDRPGDDEPPDEGG